MLVDIFLSLLEMIIDQSIRGERTRDMNPIYLFDLFTFLSVYTHFCRSLSSTER